MYYIRFRLIYNQKNTAIINTKFDLRNIMSNDIREKYNIISIDINWFKMAIIIGTRTFSFVWMNLSGSCSTLHTLLCSIVM